MTGLDGPFDVLGVNVAAVHNDQILESAGNIELAVSQESQVARAEERAVIQAGQGRPERLLGHLGSIPVAGCYAGPGNPDLTHSILGAGTESVRIDDDDRLSLGHVTRANQGLGALGLQVDDISIVTEG